MRVCNASPPRDATTLPPPKGTSNPSISVTIPPASCSNGHRVAKDQGRRIQAYCYSAKPYSHSQYEQHLNPLYQSYATPLLLKRTQGQGERTRHMTVWEHIILCCGCMSDKHVNIHRWFSTELSDSCVPRQGDEQPQCPRAAEKGGHSSPRFRAEKETCIIPSAAPVQLYKRI